MRISPTGHGITDSPVFLLLAPSLLDLRGTSSPALFLLAALLTAWVVAARPCLSGLAAQPTARHLFLGTAVPALSVWVPSGRAVPERRGAARSASRSSLAPTGSVLPAPHWFRRFHAQ